MTKILNYIIDWPSYIVDWAIPKIYNSWNKDLVDCFLHIMALIQVLWVLGIMVTCISLIVGIISALIL